MDVLEVILYVILTLILLALIGVLSWLIYDYYEYKKAVKSKISETVAQSDDSNSLLKKDVTTDYDNKFSKTSNYILHTSNFLTSDYDNKFDKTSNYILSTSNYIASDYNNMFDNSSANLNKFFTFGLNNNNIANNKIRDRIWENADITKLELMKETIAKSNLTAEKGVKIFTDSTATSKGLELCDKTGGNCWNLFVDSMGDLKVARPNDPTYSLSFIELGAPEDAV
jgi:hypothetical protein